MALSGSGWLVRGAVAGLTLAAAAEVGFVLLGHNFRVVIPGRVYRSAQPSAADVQNAVDRYGVRTVINLRGCCADTDWYAAEARGTAACDICQEDITLSAGRLPAPQELRRLLEVLDRAEFPILVHCRRGVDRTGLVSAAVMLLDPGVTPRQAREQLSLLHGHVPLGRTAAMLRFYDLYDRWLERTGREHSPANFRDFLARGYRPGAAWGRIEVLEVPPLRLGQTAAVRVRAHNNSDGDWQLKPGTGTGIHLKFQVTDTAGRQVQEGHAGLFAARVPAGGSVDLTLALNKPTATGAYTLVADLLDGPETSFAQLGNEPLVLELTVR